MQPATRAGLSEVERETLETFLGSLRPPPPGGDAYFTLNGLISHVQCAPAARFFRANPGQRSSEAPQKPMLGVNCAPKATDFTLCPLALARPLDCLSAGQTTSPVMSARDSMGHAHRDLVSDSSTIKRIRHCERSGAIQRVRRQTHCWCMRGEFGINGPEQVSPKGRWLHFARNDEST